MHEEVLTYLNLDGVLPVLFIQRQLHKRIESSILQLIYTSMSFFSIIACSITKMFILLYAVAENKQNDKKLSTKI